MEITDTSPAAGQRLVQFDRSDREPNRIRRRRRSAFTNGAPSEAAKGSRQRTILVADDDPLLISGIALLLRGAGYGCIRARNGDEAVARAIESEQRIDLLLLDVFMPGMDGVSAWHRIQRTRPNIPCVIMSAGFDGELALRLGPAGFLAKPFEAADLLVTVRDVIATAS